MRDTFEVHYDGLIDDCKSINLSQDGQTAIVLLKATSGQQVVLNMSRKALHTLGQKISTEPLEE